MNKFEFKGQVYKLGFKLKEFAKYINVPYGTIKTYSSGNAPVPGYMNRLLQLIEENQFLKNKTESEWLLKLIEENQHLKDENENLKNLLKKIDEVVQE